MSALDIGAAAKARAAWGEAIPDWVAVLAAECDRTSANQVARRMKRSASLVSTVLRNKYPADLEAIEEVVRGVFMRAEVICPALGTIPANVCRDWRGTPFSNVNSLRVQMFRACARCPRNTGDRT